MSKIQKTSILGFSAIAFFIAGLFLFYNLSDRLLWGDEAETALLGINITKYGIPKATDGKNYITLLGAGVDTRNDIWIWRPWLDNSIAAVSMALLGKTTLAARLPFALIGFLSVILLVWVIHKIYTDNRMTMITAILYITNVSFLLHARQCRYYAIVCLAQILLIYGYYLLHCDNSKKAVPCLSAALVMLFYSNYMLVLPPLLVLAAASVFYARQRSMLKATSITFTVFMVMIIPWLSYAQPWIQAGGFASGNAIENFGGYLRQIHFYITPLVLLLAPAALYMVIGKQSSDLGEKPEIQATRLFLWVLVTVHLSFISFAQLAFLRYILPLIPVLIILSSLIITRLVKNPVLQCILVSVLALSNLIPVTSAYLFGIRQEVTMPIVSYFRDITTDYENTLENVVTFLKKNACPEQSIAVSDPEFPIIFYTDMRIINLCFNKNLELNNLPDWIFAESASGVLDLPILRPIPAIDRMYETVTLRVRNTPRWDCSPEPDYHSSFTDQKWKMFTMYKKRK